MIFGQRMWLLSALVLRTCPGLTFKEILISLAEEISKERDVESVTWMLLIAVMQIYGGKKKPDWAE